jgi:hypothetical protein
MPNININIDADGNISCKRKRVKNGQQVEWKCETPFAVDFGWETPVCEEVGGVDYPKEQLVGKQAAPNAPYKTDQMKAVAPAAAGASIKFKYTVAVLTENGIIIEDPEIIIDP